MPIIKSAKKRMKQTEERTTRLRPYKTRMLTMVKNILKWAKSGEIEKAEKSLSETYQSIDTALKKKILHKNTAGRKKSLVQRSVTNAKKSTPAKSVTKKAEVKDTKKAASPKVEQKKSSKKVAVKSTTVKKPTEKKVSKK
jgi:small subunit ribosomal protein S20